MWGVVFQKPATDEVKGARRKRSSSKGTEADLRRMTVPPTPRLWERKENNYRFSPHPFWCIVIWELGSNALVLGDRKFQIAVQSPL